MPSLSTSITLDNTYPIYIADAAEIAGTIAWQKANSVFCPVGPSPLRAWFLMRKGDIDVAFATSGSSGGGGSNAQHRIRWTSKVDGANQDYDFHKLYFVRSERILHGGVGDANALHLVEFTDARGVLCKYTDTANLQKNVRSYAHDADHLEGTGGATWTSLLESLWTLCAGLGSYPGLPAGFAPDGIPENARFLGVNAYHALNAVLDKLDCALAYEPLNGIYRIVRLGAEQATIEPPGNSLKWSGDPMASNVIRAPEKLRVYFVNHYQSYGQERDAEQEENWSVSETDPAAGIFIEVTTNVPGALTGTVKGVWDDLPRLLDENNEPTNADALTTRANARTTGWVQRMSVQLAHKVYIGIQNFAPGSQIRAVLWKNWGEGEGNDISGGTVTEIVCRPELVTGFEGGDLGHVHFLSDASHENYQPLDLARRTYPNFPRLPNIVQVHHSEGSFGQEVMPNADGFHPGKVRRWVANDLEVLEDCWILFVDQWDSVGGQVSAVDGDCYGPARLSGVSTSSGVLRAVYALRKGGAKYLKRFELTSNLALSGSADAEFVGWNGAAYVKTGQAIVVKDFTEDPGSWQGTVGFRGWCWLPDDNDAGKHEIVWMETFAKFTEAAADGDASYAGGGLGNQVNVTVSHSFDGKELTADPVVAVDPQEMFKNILDGAKMYTVYDPERDKLVIYNSETKAGLLGHTLGEDADGATLVGTTVDVATGTQQDIQDPVAAEVSDSQGLFPTAKENAKGIALLDAKTGNYIMVQSESLAGLIQFTLEDSLETMTATAQVDFAGGTQQDTQGPTDDVNVYDGNEMFPRAVEGAKGSAILDSKTESYNVVACQQLAIMVSSVIPSDINSGQGLKFADTSFSVAEANVKVVSPSPFNQKPTGTLTIQKKLNVSVAAGVGFIAVWHDEEQEWWLLQVFDSRCEDPPPPEE